MLNTNRVNISASIGISVFPVEAQDAESLLKHADQAMYVAKAEGRNRFGYFTESMQQEAIAKHSLTNDLRNALSRNELEVYYQPIVDLSSGLIFKAEALLRWKHPKLSMISPATFIPLAEESGLIHEIGEWVLNESIESVKRWLDQFGRIIQVSVNKSPIQFDRKEEFTWVDALNSLRLPGNSITVEITEGLLLKESIKVKQQLLALKNGGIEVSIDDFGTGFSALSYLKKFDIDYLKIDRSFIKDLELEENDVALTEAIIVMAHKLGIKTIAEGVETEGQFNLLKSFGCDYAQGFLFSPAVPAAEFEQIISRQS
jgi:EAL domain-containing protein (putative c-di-GMP-specific phosphodiesterase class I)